MQELQRCTVCGGWTTDGVILASIDEWVHLCSPLCRVTFAEGTADYLGAALLRVGPELYATGPLLLEAS